MSWTIRSKCSNQAELGLASLLLQTGEPGSTCLHGYCASKDFDVTDGSCLAPTGGADSSHADRDGPYFGPSQWKMRHAKRRNRVIGNCIRYGNQSYNGGATRKLHLDAWSGSHMDCFSLSNTCSFARDVVANEVWSHPRNFLGPFRGLVPSSNASTAWFSHGYK